MTESKLFAVSNALINLFYDRATDDDRLLLTEHLAVQGRYTFRAASEPIFFELGFKPSAYPKEESGRAGVALRSTVKTLATSGVGVTALSIGQGNCIRIEERSNARGFLMGMAELRRAERESAGAIIP